MTICGLSFGYDYVQVGKDVYNKPPPTKPMLAFSSSLILPAPYFLRISSLASKWSFRVVSDSCYSFWENKFCVGTREWGSWKQLKQTTDCRRSSMRCASLRCDGEHWRDSFRMVLNMTERATDIISPSNKKKWAHPQCIQATHNERLSDSLVALAPSCVCSMLVCRSKRIFLIQENSQGIRRKQVVEVVFCKKDYSRKIYDWNRSRIFVSIAQGRHWALRYWPWVWWKR